jgi:arylsulfatase A-like enzyme
MFLYTLNRIRPWLLGLAGALVTITVAAAPRPNIVLIMCDDMGFSDIGCYGGEVETPNLDRLASEGMRFTQFYNNAKCTTTRASLLTGLYPRFGQPGHLRNNMITLGEAMQRSGYRTSLSGKWHLMKTRGAVKNKVGSWIRDFDRMTHPYFRGFERFYGLLDGGSNFFNPVQPDPPYKGGRIRSFGVNDQAVTQFPEDYYATDAFTDHAINSIREFVTDEKPFFLHLTYTAPHYPLHAKPEDIAKYRGRYRDGWDVMRKTRWERQKSMGLSNASWSFSEGDSRAYDWSGADHDFEDHRMAVYAAMIDSMDQNIGRLRQALEDEGGSDNTLILFHSDNGGCAEEPGGRDPKVRKPGPKEDYVAVGPSWGWAQNVPFRRYKSWVHEGGITTRMIAWWPGHVPEGAINRSVAHIIDLLPTFLELAGNNYPKSYKGRRLLPVEGKSMASLLSGSSRAGHESLAWFWSGNRAIRQNDWKLVWDKGIKKWGLYDLSQDRCETHGLALKNPNRVASMSESYLDWAEEMELKLKD